MEDKWICKVILSAFLSLFLLNNVHAQNQIDAKGRKQGRWEKLDEAGRKLYIGTFKDDVPVGEFRHFYPNGKLKAINNYRLGGHESFAILFNSDGLKEAEGLYIDKKKDSLWVYYDSNGIKLSEETYSRGIKNGEWRQYYPGGKLLRVEFWTNDKKEGKWLMYYENGKIQQEVNYKNGLLHGDFLVFDSEGNPSLEGKYKEDQPSGNWFYYQGKGQIKYIEQYKDGKRISRKMQNGTEELTYPNGIPQSVYHYKNGKKNGSFVEYYNTGTYRKRKKAIDPNALEAANPIEEWEEYLEGQKIKVKGFYKEDKLDGEILYFSTDGKLANKEYYKEGILQK